MKNMGFRSKNKSKCNEDPAQAGEQRSKTERREKFRVQSYELRVKPQNSELHTPYSELNFGGCGILIVGGLPCGVSCASHVIKLFVLHTLVGCAVIPFYLVIFVLSADRQVHYDLLLHR